MPHMIPFPGAFAVGVAIFLIVIWDAFEAVILPRRVTRKYRLTRGFYRVTWSVARFVEHASFARANAARIFSASTDRARCCC